MPMTVSVLEEERVEKVKEEEMVMEETKRPLVETE